MSEIYLVRHAQASFGEGDYDRLSPLGHRQATWLGEYFRFRELQFDRIICGDMIRHHQTLDDICSAMGLDPANRESHSQWNEFDFQTLIGAYLAEHPGDRPEHTAPASAFSRLLQNTMRAWVGGTLKGDIPESWAEFEERVRAGLDYLTKPYGRNSRTLVVSSGGAIAMAIRQVLAAPPEAMIQMNVQTRNSAYSHLFFSQDSMHLAGFNHVPHLEQPERHTAVTYF